MSIETKYMELEKKMQQAISNQGKHYFDVSEKHSDPLQAALYRTLRERQNVIDDYWKSTDKKMHLDLFEQYNTAIKDLIGL